MRKYVFSASSPQKYDTGKIIKVILNCPSMQWLFPIKMLLGRAKFHHFETPDELDMMRIAKEIQDVDPYLSDTKTISFRAIGQNVNCTISLKLEENPFMTSDLILEIYQKENPRWEEQLGYLRQMLLELIPIFQVQAAIFYDPHPKPFQKTWLKITPYYRPKGYVGWMFYYVKEVVEAIGCERFETLSVSHEKQEINGGYFIPLQADIMDWEQEAHRLREEQAIAELGLERFIKTKIAPP
jgi:hypothetical protein